VPGLQDQLVNDAEQILNTARHDASDLLDSLSGHRRELLYSRSSLVHGVLVDTGEVSIRASAVLAHLVHVLQALKRLREHERSLQGSDVVTEDSALSFNAAHDAARTAHESVV
jgi:hypothetical protein